MQTLVTSITDALSALPDVRLGRVEFDPQAMDSGADLEITLDVQGRPVRLLIAQKKNAQPRDVRALAEPLSRLHARECGMPTVPMLITPALPLSSREFLRSRRIAYGDGGGSLYLPLPAGLFYVDRPVPRRAVRETLNVFKGNAVRVLHVLLDAPARSWHVQDLASEARISSSTAHQVLSVLESQLWVESQGKGPARVRVLSEPGKLLDAWREEHSLKQYEAQPLYGWAKSGGDLRARVTGALEAAGTGYALTLSSGAELVAPFVTGVPQMSLLVPSDSALEPVWQAAGLQPAEEGANVSVLLSRGDAPLIGRRQVEGMWVASDVQLYLDLWASAARGKEQAAHLRRERLKF